MSCGVWGSALHCIDKFAIFSITTLLGIEVRLREYLSSELAPPAMPSMPVFNVSHCGVNHNIQTVDYPQYDALHPQFRPTLA
jgi:hypothetical protein